MSSFNTIIIALFWSIFVAGISITIFYITGGIDGASLLNRFSVLLGGNFLNGGYIQFLTFFAFFWALLDIKELLRLNKEEDQSMDQDFLPQREHYVISPNDVNNIRLNVLQFESSNRKYFLTDLIKKACTKFRANRSVAEVIDVVGAQMKINQANAESGQAVIRYLLWAIPSIGFIGTVLGISQALSIADSGDTKLITTTLGVAFDTTLVALFLSVIAMWYFHQLQAKTDKLHADMEEYVIENLVNRIDLQ